jgi:hypothetical protein
MCCEALNKDAVLRYGIGLSAKLIPLPIEIAGYTWYIMPEGGAYVWDA